MGSKTKHIGLELTDSGRPDSNTLFSSWRSCMNGIGVGSNMELIDEAYGEMSAEIDDARSDLINTRAELEQGISNVQIELTNDLTDTRAALEQNISDVKDDLGTEILTARTELDNAISNTGIQLNALISDVQTQLSIDIEGVKDELLAHITEALTMFNTLNSNLETIRTEFDQRFSTAILDGDSVVIDCGTAFDDMQNAPTTQ